MCRLRGVFRARDRRWPVVLLVLSLDLVPTRSKGRGLSGLRVIATCLLLNGIGGSGKHSRRQSQKHRRRHSSRVRTRISQQKEIQMRSSCRVPLIQGRNGRQVGFMDGSISNICCIVLLYRCQALYQIGHSSSKIDIRVLQVACIYVSFTYTDQRYVYFAGKDYLQVFGTGHTLESKGKRAINPRKDSAAALRPSREPYPASASLYHLPCHLRDAGSVES